MTTPPPLHHGAGPGWWRRNWRWVTPLILLSVLAVFAAVLWFAVSQWSNWSRGSEPYREAMRRARCSVELVAHLGEPIQDGFLPMGSMALNSNGSGSSEFVVQLRGPRGEARMFMNAERSRGEWDYPMLYAVTGQADPIDLTALDDAEAAQECELRTCRAQGSCPVTGTALEV